MGRTLIFASKDETIASKKADFWRGAGLSVTSIGPSDFIEITGEAAPKIVWDSGVPADWYIVIGTKDPHGGWLPPASAGAS